jgi:L,D-peptidoglycan transpeptidase YkuD (ErfK/YbiS/YcfS/YnhG family)
MTLRGRLTTFCVALAVVLAPVPAAGAAPVTSPFGQPVDVGDARQVLTVKPAHAGSSQATLNVWAQRSDGRWARTLGPIPARVGARGTTGSPREGRAATPRGTYTLTQAFGIQPRPSGVTMPYRRVWAKDWWVSDPRSRYYNTWQVGPPNGRWNPAYGEQLKRYGAAYDHALVIDFNRRPVVAGRGSAIFLHVGTGGATAGCVSVPRYRMLQVLRYLRPSLRPRIAIA